MGINENNLITCVQKEGKLSRLQLSDTSLQRRSCIIFGQGSSQRQRQGSQRHCFNPFEVFFTTLELLRGPGIVSDKSWGIPQFRASKNTTCQQTEIDLI